MTAAPPEAPMTMTVREAAAELRISRAQAYILVGRGLLPTIRVGERHRVVRAELARLVAEGRLDTTPNGGSR